MITCTLVYIFHDTTGTYQMAEGQAECDPCPSRMYCDPWELGNVTGIITPVDCPIGYYCPTSTEYEHQYPCPPGTYGAEINLESQCENLSIMFLVCICMFFPHHYC